MSNKTFCDDCGKEIKGGKARVFPRLPFDVASANKGESAVLCLSCPKYIKIDGNEVAEVSFHENRMAPCFDVCLKQHDKNLMLRISPNEAAKILLTALQGKRVMAKKATTYFWVEVD